MARILVVDDSWETVELIRRVLSNAGHEPIPAYGGHEALTKVVIERPDIVILDLMMPDMDGFETLRLMRGMPETNGLPVIVITASADQDLEQRVALAGGNACLHKPIDVDILIEAIDNHINDPQRLPLRQPPFADRR